MLQKANPSGELGRNLFSVFLPILCVIDLYSKIFGFLNNIKLIVLNLDSLMIYA